MKIICMFDLPVETLSQKREYTLFRKTLLKNGFIMMQYSVYIRTCPNKTFATKFISKLKIKSPSDGNIRIFMITEKQYEDMILILGSKKNQELIVGKDRIVVI